MAVIPNSNVNLATNIRDVLNAAGGSVTNDTTTFFTSSANINMWSKHKPVPLTADFPDYNGTWWKGNSGNCGINITQYNSMDEVYNATTGSLNGWSYTLPSGGSYEPFRLGDFRGYSTDAVPPFKAFKFPERVQTGSTVTATFEYNPTTTDSRSLQLADFSSLDNCYLGVMVWDTTTNKRLVWNTTSTTIKNGANQVSVKMSVSYLGARYKAVPFLSTATQLQGAAIQSAVYYTVPKIDKVLVNVVEELDELSVQAQYEYGSGGIIPSRLKYKFSFTNWSEGSTSNNTVKLLNSSGGTEYSANLPNFTLAYKQKYNYPYDYNGNEWASISVLNLNTSAITHLRIGIGNSRIYKDVAILQLPQ